MTFPIDKECGHPELSKECVVCILHAHMRVIHLQKILKEHLKRKPEMVTIKIIGRKT
jgi:hypothetical protein